MRKETAPLLGKTQMDPQMMDMMKFYSSKWRSKSMFQVLLRYRAARYQDLVQFSQQVSDLSKPPGARAASEKKRQ